MLSQLFVDWWLATSGSRSGLEVVEVDTQFIVEILDLNGNTRIVGVSTCTLLHHPSDHLLNSQQFHQPLFHLHCLSQLYSLVHLSNQVLLNLEKKKYHQYQFLQIHWIRILVKIIIFFFFLFFNYYMRHINNYMTIINLILKYLWKKKYLIAAILITK